MERVKTRAPNPASNPTDNVMSQNSKSPGKELPHLCEKREKLQQQRKKCPHPIVHPDVAQAQAEENSGFRYNEDSRPMFSPIPRNFTTSDGEESPRGFNFKGAPVSKEKTSFPAIHVEKCDKSQPSYITSCSPEPPGNPSPDSDMEIDQEVMSQGSTGGLNVPSPYLHRKSDGRVVLVTQDSNLRQLSSSEGNLPEALRRSLSSPGGHGHLLDLRYRPDWQPQPALRQSSDMALHELRREGETSPVSPRRFPARLEPLPALSQTTRTRSANSLQSP